MFFGSDRRLPHLSLFRRSQHRSLFHFPLDRFVQEEPPDSGSTRRRLVQMVAVAPGCRMRCVDREIRSAPPERPFWTIVGAAEPEVVNRASRIELNIRIVESQQSIR